MRVEKAHPVIEEINLGPRIRDLRVRRRMSLRQLAASTGLSPALISKVERNAVSPPIPTLWRLAEALGVRMGYFFHGDAGATSDVAVTRRDKRRVVFREGSKYGYLYESLTYGKREPRLDAFVVTVAPEDRRGGKLFSHPGDELIFVLEGRVEFTLDDRSHTLEAGDSVYFDSERRHRVTALDGAPARTLQVVYSL